MAKQKFNPEVKHASNQTYRDSDKSRKPGSKDKTNAISLGRILKWIFGIRED